MSHMQAMAEQCTLAKIDLPAFIVLEVVAVAAVVAACAAADPAFPVLPLVVPSLLA
jgi:hypothetical protein